jgi:hypothetical protein
MMWRMSLSLRTTLPQLHISLRTNGQPRVSVYLTSLGTALGCSVRGSSLVIQRLILRASYLRVSYSGLDLTTHAHHLGLADKGTAVYWYGLVRANSGPSTFTAVLDGIPTAFDIPNLTCHEPGQTDLCCQALYSQTGLAAQTHSLAIVNTGSLSHNDNLDFSVVAFLYVLFI